MKRFLRVTMWVCLLLTGWISFAQQSANVVDYQLTYDASSALYTAWVVPRYNVPNANNATSTEKGGTAQFTIKVPASFIISNITDVNGQWEKAPLRLGPGNPGQNWTGSGLDLSINYYVIGKSPSETNYGTFTSGVPVRLFTFKGNGCQGPVVVMEPGNLFIAQSDSRYSLNVANSFYSLSGSPAGGNQQPLEQFQAVTGNPAQCSSLTANPDSQTLAAGTTTTTVSVLTNDINNGQPASTTNVTVTVTTPPATGTALVNPNGTISFTFPPGFSGPVSFVYTICDIAQPTVCASAPVNLTVTPTTTVLVANPDSQTSPAGTTTTVAVLGNDTRNGQPISTTSVTVTVNQPTSGTATVNPNGTVSFTPAPGFSGPVSFTYTICDIAQPTVCTSAPVSLTVKAVPTALTANPDNQTLTAGTTTTIPVLANDFSNGLPASTTSVTVTVNQPTSGTATVNPNGTVSFTPAPGFTGPISFTYTICSIAQPTVCSSAPISLTVNPAATVLVANPDSQTLTANTATTVPVLANDTRNGLTASSANVTVTVTTPPAMGTATVNSNGSIGFTPAPGFTGVVSFTYTICDIAQPTICTSAPISLTVKPTPVVLVANPDSQTLTTGTTTAITPLINDTRNGQPISNTSVTVTVTQPTAGTATVNPNGTISFTPAPGFTGPISFTYTICDIAQPTVCSSAPVSLFIAPVPTQSADLLITKQVSQSKSAMGDVVSFTVTVQNMGPASAVGVVVSDTILRNKSVQLQGTPTTSKGSFNTTTGLWSIGGLAANEKATFVLSVRILAEGVIVNVASVTATGTLDPSTSNNLASACTSVPYVLCSGESLTISVPKDYLDVRWYRNNGATPVSTGNSIVIDLPGTYTVSASNGTCPIAGCCPIIIEQGECCPPDKCVPFVIRKTKSRL